MEFNKAYSRQEFVRFLQNSFLPEDFVPSEEEVWFRTKMTYSTEAVKLGTCQSLELVVYEVKHRSKHNARVSLSKEAFRMLADEMKDRALVIFVPEDSNANYRFSFIEITIDFKEDSSKVSYNYSNPRRYSYFLGEGIAYYTPNKYLNEKGRVVSKEDLLSRFSVEVLTKEFYQELSDWYAWAIKIIRFPNDISETVEERKKTEVANKNEKKNDKYNNEGIIRLITRLIFVWFLKQRHLIPDEFFDEKYIADHLIKDFNPYKMEGLMHDTGEVKYYTAILQNLFFAMLNSPITTDGSKKLSGRHFRKLNEQGKPDRSDYDNNKLMRYESYFTNPKLFVELANKTVPFLNGGLFDCLDDKDNGIYFDGFSDNEKSVKLLNIPDFLFFIPEENVDLSVWYNDKRKKRVKVRGLINILKRYNFTVEENTPFDKEVSLDPELLGKVFENLLASYNPETQTTARKQTGSFYTPREIVQYMVDESLIAHLKRTVGEELEPQYRQLMQYSDDEVELTFEQRKNIMQSLYNCKILDPACGSGAFPMGILQQMVHILNRIDPSIDMWKTMMRNVAIERTSEAYMSASDEERNEIINDIERSFDESINRPDYARKLYLIENCIYGVDIQPIAIQISKLRFFISLVVDQNTNTDPTDNFGIRPLPNLEAKFVAANTLIGLQKKDASLFDSEAIKAKENELKIAKHKIFGAKTVRTKRKYRQIVNDLRLEIATLLKENGALGNDEARELASWDMFDQNSSSPFFDPEWMFGVKEGFDIVIGNPPYVFTRDVDFSGEFKKYVENEFFSKVLDNSKKSKSKQSGKINLFAIFIMKGVMLNSPEGILSYIIPNNILRTTTYDIVRKYILDNTSVCQIVDLGSGIFEKVTASTIILQLSNKIKKDNNLSVITEVENLTLYQFSKKQLPQDQFKINTSFAFNILGETQTMEISKRIENFHSYLGELCLFISPGIDGNKEKYIADSKINNKYKPIIFGKNIKRFSIDFDDKYVLYDKKLLNRSRNESIFVSNKIVTQRISGGLKPIVAAFDNGTYYTFNSINNIILKDNNIYDLYAVLALLNSDLINWYYAKNFSNESTLTVNISKTYLEKIPIPKIDTRIKELMYHLVDELITLGGIDFENSRTLELDRKLNCIIYKLYGLDYNEILWIDPQTSITQEEYEKGGDIC